MKNILSLGAIPEIEAEIYQKEDVYFPSIKSRNNEQKKLLIEAFEFHYNNNETYKQFCDKQRVGLADVRKDHKLIPLIPSTIFKTINIRTNSNEKTVKKCLSSGTQGSTSVIERDNTTLERFLGSIRNAIDNVFNIEDAIVLNLGPSAEDAQDIWFSYVMSVSDMIFSTINYVQNNVFQIEKLVADIKEYNKEYKTILLIGAPIMFLELHKYLLAHSLKIDFGHKIFVNTAGGWKKHEGESVSKQTFKECCKEIFVGLDEKNIRDTFNMVELNTILPECECGSKHVPLWLDIFSINLDTYGIAKQGEVGLLAFLDASPKSYPGFIMSGDLGKVSYIDNCPCGRKGICIEVIRRINTIESRGCALKIEKNYTNQ